MSSHARLEASVFQTKLNYKQSRRASIPHQQAHGGHPNPNPFILGAGDLKKAFALATTIILFLLELELQAWMLWLVPPQLLQTQPQLAQHSAAELLQAVVDCTHWMEGAHCGSSSLKKIADGRSLRRDPPHQSLVAAGTGACFLLQGYAPQGRAADSDTLGAR